MNNKPTIERLLQQSRDIIEIPSRTEFRDMMKSVTNVSYQRNTQQKGIQSPFVTIMNFTKNKLIIAGSVALLAIIIIVPTVRHQRMIATSTQLVQQETIITDEQSVVLMQESKGTISEDIIADIMTEFNQEDAVTTQELADDEYIESDYEIDSAIIS